MWFVIFFNDGFEGRFGREISLRRLVVYDFFFYGFSWFLVGFLMCRSRFSLGGYIEFRRGLLGSWYFYLVGGDGVVGLK